MSFLENKYLFTITEYFNDNEVGVKLYNDLPYDIVIHVVNTEYKIHTHKYALYRSRYLMELIEESKDEITIGCPEQVLSYKEPFVILIWYFSILSNNLKRNCNNCYIRELYLILLLDDYMNSDCAYMTLLKCGSICLEGFKRKGNIVDHIRKTAMEEHDIYIVARVLVELKKIEHPYTDQLFDCLDQIDKPNILKEVMKSSLVVDYNYLASLPLSYLFA